MENKVYNYYGFHCIQLIDICCSILDGYSGFLVGNIIKYVYRAGIKTLDYKQDLLKALDYLKEFKKVKNAARLRSTSDISLKARNITSEETYKYLLLVSDMEHYKNKFFSLLLFVLVTQNYKNIDNCINILNEQVYRKGDNNENSRRNEN